jgi:MerR family copper efflux transcriptional regulator
LGRIRAALDTLIASCPGGGALRACTILDAIAQVAGAKDSTPRERAPLRATEEDEPAARSSSDMKTSTFTIRGMHCDGCAETVNALLAREPGVKTSTVSFQEGKARALYDPSVTSSDRLIAVIERAGYRAAQSA